MLLALVLSASAADVDPWARVLAACVGGGRVDYACVRTHRADMDAVLASVAAPHSERPPLGWWIDAYNAHVLLAMATEPALPAQVLDLPGFFDQRTYKVNGGQLTLNALEGRARADHRDARLHFAFNCAAMSCPPMRAAPWPDDPAVLAPALAAATATFLAGSGVQIDDVGRELRVSKLFEWYRDDFLAEAPSIEAWILAHLTDPKKKALVEEAVKSNYTLTFLPYDWRPNVR